MKKYNFDKNKLLKDWGEGRSYELHTLHAVASIKLNMIEGITYTAGSKPKSPSGSIEWSDSITDIENLFGLPYTSSSGFGAIWNTNTEARTKYGRALWFRGVALDQEGEAVLMFEDKNEREYWFRGQDFSNYIRAEREKEKAKREAETQKNANKLLDKLPDIFKKYAGKSYGESTKKAVAKDIDAIADPLGLSCWLYSEKEFSGGYYCKIEIAPRGAYSWRTIYGAQFLTNDNKIQVPSEPLTHWEEFDGVKLWEQREKIKRKIEKSARELLPLLDEFRDMSNKLRKQNKTTDAHACQVSTIANYGLKIDE